MEEVEVPPIHKHPLIPFTRFAFGKCKGCRPPVDGYIYGGYRCNELGCDNVVFHKECAKPSPVINHSSHPDHSLIFTNLNLKPTNVDSEPYTCTLCENWFGVGYRCSTCDFELDLACARRPAPFALLENSYGHEHQLKLSSSLTQMLICKACLCSFSGWGYICHPCEFAIHVDCVESFPRAYHTSHPQHPLKSYTDKILPYYADKYCLLCGQWFDHLYHHKPHYCDVCNFSICRGCMGNPPPLGVVSATTHEHQLHLVPRRLDFTCNACGTQGDRSPYFCLQCNFMIHWECIDLPRVININRHDHRISYTRRLGYGKWICGVCRDEVDGFYGAYSCSKCSNYVLHSLCATSGKVWDMVELEGVPEEEEMAPFEVIDDKTIKHFSHDHNLHINNDGRILRDNIVCAACVFEICSESFYSCEQCDFILHKRCANLPRKKRHVCHNLPFTLRTDSHLEAFSCMLCKQLFTGFRYEVDSHNILDVRCGSISEPFVHKSHPHALYYSTDFYRFCSACACMPRSTISCDECDFRLCFKYAFLPQNLMRRRYDDHPLFLSFGGDLDVDGEYWCDACETKVNPKEWFYTCNDCGTTLHISCVVGDFSYIMPGSVGDFSYMMPKLVTSSNPEVISNTSICRPLCLCNSRCKLSTILKFSKAGVDLYICSFKCRHNLGLI
ncbi:PREDICTED: uncharacterized protein LOC104773078 [Camelina sativa]|uniref:Uncharacterized protein LOC104773078 n=1 Tax=Camelina sativa TaxID=90675 RepID=A0ABM0Y5P7_CAMSA|nr:PREDICTED: uncharacterized protein LOC104773078 [Camelina sativa]